MLIEQALELHRAGKLDAAEAAYRQVLAREEDNLNALQLLGALTQDTGRAAEAVVLLQRAAAVLAQKGESAQHASLYYNLGNALRAAGRTGEAIASYRHGLALDPAMPELHAMLAAELIRQGDLPAAILAYETALRLKPGRPDWLLNLANIRAALGEVEQAVVLYHRVLALEPNRHDALHALALALLSLARPSEAIAPLTRLAADLTDNPLIHRELGNAQFGAKQLDAALASFNRVLALQPGDAEAHWMIGCIRQAQGRLEEAEQAYRRALELNPDHVGALFNLGALLHREQGNPAAAIPLFEHLAEIAPDHVEVHCALGNALRSVTRIDDAVASYRRYLERLPGSALAHLLVGESLSETGQKEAAIPYLEQALKLDPSPSLAALAHIDLGSALQDLGRTAEAQTHFRAALTIKPLASHKAIKAKADFSALFVLAPGAYNTPYEYLIERADFDSHVLLLLPNVDYDVASLASQCDVVVNLVSDVDQGKAMLPVAAALLDRLGKPVINDPEKIAATGRESISALLSDIPFCRVPKVERHAGTAILEPGFSTRFDALRLPFLARLAGRHGGDEFEMVEAASDLERLVARHKESDYYLIEYLDYQSADGFFRKYRFIFAGDAILPYHLAIGTEWKVHHFRTDMANQLWMQQEEEAFLRAPETVFEPRHFDALRAIRDIVGLDFLGIDCGLDRDGNLVLFETNASMLVHGNNLDFPYKTPYVRQVKAAFAAMLARAAAA